MAELHLPQVENKDSCLLSQLRPAAAISVHLLQDPPLFVIATVHWNSARQKEAEAEHWCREVCWAQRGSSCFVCPHSSQNINSIMFCCTCGVLLSTPLQAAGEAMEVEPFGLPTVQWSRAVTIFLSEMTVVAPKTFFLATYSLQEPLLKFLDIRLPSK